MFAQLPHGKAHDGESTPNAITAFRIVLAPALLIQNLAEAAYLDARAF